LIGTELELSREKTRVVLKEKNIQGFIKKALEILFQKNRLETTESFVGDDSNRENTTDISFENAIEYLFETKKNDRNDDFFFDSNPFLH